MASKRRFGESDSRYLKASELKKTDGTYRRGTLQIETVANETVGEEKEHRFVLYFKGQTKGMVLNVTNETVLVETFGVPPGETDDVLTTHFAGKRVLLYVDPSVTYAGKRVGGLRLAIPQGQPPPAEAPVAQAAPPAPAPMEEPEGFDLAPPGDGDDIPF